jgi:hypothetical protein
MSAETSSRQPGAPNGAASNGSGPTGSQNVSLSPSQNIANPFGSACRSFSVKVLPCSGSPCQPSRGSRPRPFAQPLPNSSNGCSEVVAMSQA